MDGTAELRAIEQQLSASTSIAGTAGRATRADARARIRGYSFIAFRILYPLVLIGIPIFLLAFGAPIIGSVAILGGTFLLVLGVKPLSRRWRGAQAGAALTFVIATALGLPQAVFFFNTEGCVGEAADLSDGDVRSMSDPRLNETERDWVQRTHALLSLSWPDETLPPIDEATLANIVVKARTIVSEIVWRGRDKPVTRLGLWEAKEAYAAKHFDRRQVCHLYQRGAPTPKTWTARNVDRGIVDQTDAALALIIPALQTTVETIGTKADETRLAEFTLPPLK